jgi:hypothetical protein
VLTVENDLMRDFQHKEASFRGIYIYPSDHSFGKALPWTGWMEVDANLIPNRNLLRQSLNHSG